MRTIPPPIHSIELRNRLSELFKEALRMKHRATPLYVLHLFGDMVSGQEQTAVSRDALAEAAERTFDQVGIGMTAAEAIDELLATQFLRASPQESWQARLVPEEALQGELPAATSRIDAYCRVLKRVSRQRFRSVGPVERALEEAAYLFNEGLFFEVHEVLEAVWLTEAEGARLLLQGFIQIAVGFHHLENNNLRGALSLLKEGVEKVREGGPHRFGPELDRFLASVDSARRSIESLGEAAFVCFDRRMIPQMPFMRNTLSDVGSTG